MRQKGTVQYRWKADEAGFAMPVKVGDAAHWTLIDAGGGGVEDDGVGEVEG